MDGEITFRTNRGAYDEHQARSVMETRKGFMTTSRFRSWARFRWHIFRNATSNRSGAMFVNQRQDRERFAETARTDLFIGFAGRFGVFGFCHMASQ